jgi:hypothetical protein
MDELLSNAVDGESKMAPRKGAVPLAVAWFKRQSKTVKVVIVLFLLWIVGSVSSAFSPHDAPVAKEVSRSLAQLEPAPFSKLTQEQKTDATAMHERIADDMKQVKNIAAASHKTMVDIWANNIANANIISQMDPYTQDAMRCMQGLTSKYGIDEDHWDTGGK